PREPAAGADQVEQRGNGLRAGVDRLPVPGPGRRSHARVGPSEPPAYRPVDRLVGLVRRPGVAVDRQEVGTAVPGADGGQVPPAGGRYRLLPPSRPPPVPAAGGPPPPPR